MLILLYAKQLATIIKIKPFGKVKVERKLFLLYIIFL